MKKIFLAGAILFGALSITSNLGVFAGSVNAQSKMFLNPAVTEVEPGKRITIDVMSSSDSNFNTAQIDIEYTAEALELVSASATNALPSVAYSNNSPGELTFSLYKIGGTESGKNISLLKMTFEGVDGEAKIKLLESSKILEAGEALAVGGAEAIVNVNGSSNTDVSDDDQYDSGQSDEDSNADDSISDDNSPDNTNNNSDDTKQNEINDANNQNGEESQASEEECYCDSSNENDSKAEDSHTDENAVENESAAEKDTDKGSGVVVTNYEEPEENNSNLDSSQNSSAISNEEALEENSTSTILDNGKGQETEELPNTGLGSLAPMATITCLLGYAANLLRLKFNL